jgi:N-methylhydantoinase B
MVEVRAEEGSIVNCTFPAPVTFCTVYPAHEIIQAVWKALAQAAPERVSAGWGKPSYPAMMPLPGKDFYVMYHWGGSSGGGAVRGRDGFEQMGQMVTLGGLILPNAEYTSTYPCRYLEAGIDGCRGRWGTQSVEYIVDVTASGVQLARGFADKGIGVAGERPD